MHPEVDELRPKLKEILYDCAVDIRATKAALYLLDAETRKYELAADFGFRAGIRQVAGKNDPMVDRCSRGRVPFYVNSPGMDPRLSELLFEGSSERLLGVPLFSRGTLVGFIDIRDKQQKQPFDQSDVSKAQSIADRILGLFANKNIWNQRFITLADVDALPRMAPAPAAANTAPAAKPAAPQPKPAPPKAPAPHSESAMTEKIVAASRAAAGRLLAPHRAEAFGAAELEAVSESLRSVLLLPGVVAAMFSASNSGVQEVASRGTMTQDALTALQHKLQTWLSKRGESTGALRTTLRTPLGLTMQPITAAQLHKIFTAPVAAGNFRNLYLTVAFSDAPDRSTHELLSTHLNELQAAIESAVTRGAWQSMRLRVAERLVEPEFSNFADLRRHSANVAEVADVFARFLALSPADAESVKLTALVHDCGMRLLDYDRLYRKKGLTHDELMLLREHCVVGAAVVEPVLGPDIARAVLCHHERVDGAGYPNELKGDDIPLWSRIVQICDAYVAITDPNTYQMPESPDEALAAIRRGAGAMFDGALAVRFEEMMRSRTQSTKLAGR